MSKESRGLEENREKLRAMGFDVRSATEDDPIYATGLMVGGKVWRESAPATSPNSTEAPALDSFEESEEDGKRQGALRIARWKHQNEQLLGKGKKD